MLLVSGLGWGFVLFPSPNPQFNNVMVLEGVFSLREDVEDTSCERHSTQLTAHNF